MLPVKLAIDIMGSDLGPGITLQGTGMAIKRLDNAVFELFLTEEAAKENEALINSFNNKATITICTDVVSRHDLPAFALRNKLQSTMALSIKSLVQPSNGRIRNNGVISAGNTGAYMAIAKFLLKTNDLCTRPAIGKILPTYNNHPTLMLDLGANVECDAEQYVEFARLGQHFHHQSFGKSNPSIALLNIGAEEHKGNTAIKEAHRLLQATPNLNYTGFIEPNHLLTGNVDICITDGFSGNIALKSMEGLAAVVGKLFKAELKQASWMTKFGIWLVRGIFKQVQHKFNPTHHNGAVLLGLNGTVVKSHGGTDAESFFYSIKAAYDTLKHNG